MPTQQHYASLIERLREEQPKPVATPEWVRRAQEKRLPPKVIR